MGPEPPSTSVSVNEVPEAVSHLGGGGGPFGCCRKGRGDRRSGGDPGGRT